MENTNPHTTGPLSGLGTSIHHTLVPLHSGSGGSPTSVVPGPGMTTLPGSHHHLPGTTSVVATSITGDPGGLPDHHAAPPVGSPASATSASPSTRRTSRVWRYFVMVDNCHYLCRLCSFVGAYTNTTNMRKHIQHHHPERFQDILDHTRPTTRPFYANAINMMRPPSLIQSVHSGTTAPLTPSAMQQQAPHPPYQELIYPSHQSLPPKRIQKPPDLYLLPTAFHHPSSHQVSTIQLSPHIQPPHNLSPRDLSVHTYSSQIPSPHIASPHIQSPISPPKQSSPFYHSPNLSATQVEYATEPTTSSTNPEVAPSLPLSISTFSNSGESVTITTSQSNFRNSTTPTQVYPLDYHYPQSEKQERYHSVLRETSNNNQFYEYNQDPDNSNESVTVVEGVSSIEDRMSSGEGGIGGGMVEELQTAVSPEAVLGTATAPEPQDRDPTPQPTTPLPPPKPESYQLRHNNHLTIVLEALAQDESFMDVTLTAQGRSLKAHKSVLSAVSPYFRGVLRENPCQHPIIIMPRDVRYEELYSIVNYIYKGEMTVAADDLTSLLKTAELLQVSGLAPSNSPSTSVNPNMVNPLIPGPRQRSGSNSSLGSPAATLKYRTSVAHPTNDRTQHYHGINPADFMDVDMTCVKEEVASGDEDESRDVRPVNVPSSVSNTTAVSATKESERHERSRHNSSDITPSTDNLNKNSPQTSARSNSPTSNTSSLKPDPDEQLFLASNPNSNLSINSNSNSDDTSEEQAVLEPFICPHCREGHRGCDVMATHLRLKHPTKPSFLCMCGRVFLRQSIKQAHARICSVSIST
ncbi:unnamed protein product [Meganyctiphanes norvegica]|uniref:Uncharacterized protein n=1 Tax=Meganyctiphanes norvegica TaxID=48144 RepID=A0AAV2Q1P6_MEGNR